MTPDALHTIIDGAVAVVTAYVGGTQYLNRRNGRRRDESRDAQTRKLNLATRRLRKHTRMTQRFFEEFGTRLGELVQSNQALELQVKQLAGRVLDLEAKKTP